MKSLEPILQKGGIYKIHNHVNDKVYIGSAKHFHTRFRKHKSSLSGGIHHSIKLQRAWNIHGKDNFSFEPLLICENKDLLMYEQIYMQHFNSYNHGYNATKVAYSRIGVKASEETKEKMRIARLGTKLSEETKRRIGESGLGKIKSQETIMKLSLAHKGKKKSLEHIEKMRKANLGKKLSQSTKEKVSLSLIGNDRAKGYKFTEEQRLQVSKSHKGIKQNSEWIAKRIKSRQETLALRKLNLEKD